MGTLAPVCAGAGGLVAGWLVCRLVEGSATGTLARPSAARCRVASLVCAAACVSLTHVVGPTAQTLQLCLFVLVLLHLSLVDLDRRVIPNVDLVIAMLMRLAYLVSAGLYGWPEGGRLSYYLASAGGVLATLMATVLFTDWLLGADSMGGGDLKLFTVCALYVGWQQSLVLVFVSCLFGLVSSLAWARPQAEENSLLHTFPFGPSIALACVLCLVLGKVLGPLGTL